MKNILEAPFVREMCETTANMYRLGWDERNGGNISYMLDEKEVAIVPGNAFGDCGEGFARISYAYSVDHIKTALERMEEFISELKAGK